MWRALICVQRRSLTCKCMCAQMGAISAHLMGWLRLVGSLKLQVSFAKEHYERDDILQKRPMKETIFAWYYMCAQMGADMCAETIPSMCTETITCMCAHMGVDMCAETIPYRDDHLYVCTDGRRHVCRDEHLHVCTDEHLCVCIEYII